MAFTFDQVAIYGRDLEEYTKMFNLDLNSLKGKRILDCCGGPASFAFQAAERGIEVVSCDPIYGLDVSTIRNKIDQDLEKVMQKHKESPELLYEPFSRSSERRKAMEVFLNDLPDGKSCGRYVEGYLPNLPFENDSFDLCLCSNFLFIYSDIASGGMMSNSNFDLKFHLAAIEELLRVARKEIRIYPLQGPGTKEHMYLDPIVNRLVSLGHEAKAVPVQQLDIKGADKMLLITKHACA